jgi:hypothetical protein
LIPLIVQDVFKFNIVQVLPSAVTLLPVIFDPPLLLGSTILIVTFTKPFLGAEDEMEMIFDADGFVIFAEAGLIGAIARAKTNDDARARF